MLMCELGGNHWLQIKIIGINGLFAVQCFIMFVFIPKHQKKKNQQVPVACNVQLITPHLCVK